MYSHCLFCNGALGSNESIEQFPIGKRLAFDSVKGRLWVVCPSCQRWNLTPIEQRWEVVETAERLFRGQRLRAQTDNIGLAKLPDRTELVRIGRALRPEFAAWRYGRMFGQRLRRDALLVGGATTAVVAGSLISGVPALVASVTLLAPVLVVGGAIALALNAGGYARWKTTRVIGEDGQVLELFYYDLQHAKLLGDEGGDPWRLLLRHRYGQQELARERARRALGTLLARVNHAGSASGTVADATAIIAEAGAPESVASLVAKKSQQLWGDFDQRMAAYHGKTPSSREGKRSKLFDSREPINKGALWRLPPPMRLALEMALHEDSEQAALEGDLALLAVAWREAEEIAAIADNLLPPKGAQEFLERHRPDK